jgi:dTDP-4-dehydrorhamnose reductase
MEPELWLGLECTVNRVGHTYFDQITRTGHDSRDNDLELFSQIGAKVIRYPLLWERTAPDELRWEWPDRRFRQLQELRMRPLVGLLHHGSGPLNTDLLDPDFALKFSRYARACAERYPWIEDYIPVNEPLTTARFSALYGHWYPHHKSVTSFVRALLNQCKAVVLGMREIRAVNSKARLVQTEDLGKCFSTPKLSYQARFENERRWLTFDLLCGKIAPDHAIWPYLKWAGIEDRDLYWFQENPMPPDFFGLNHYLTSDRYLDEHLERFPESAHGGNGRDQYADVEAVRACPRECVSVSHRIREAWNRYRIPVVVTEAHLSCPEMDESVRWLWEIWDAAREQNSLGADVRAVTAWAVLGAYDWNILVTKALDFYEPGLFDARFSPPRPTSLATLATELARGEPPSDPALRHPGWWRRSERICYGAERPSLLNAARTQTECSADRRASTVRSASHGS